MHYTRPSQFLTSDPSLGTKLVMKRGCALVDAIGTGDDFLLVEEGAILLFATSSSGERLYLSIIGKGYVFTPHSLNHLSNSHGQIGAEAMRDLVVRRFPRSDWEIASRKQPDLYHWVVEQEAQQLHFVQFQLALHFQRSSLDRARFALCSYAQGLGIPHPCGSKTIRVSRAELATWTGVSSDRMCRLIRALHEAGEVTVTGRNIKVNNSLLRSLNPRALNSSMGALMPEGISAI